jgi:hypothetical protein
MNVTIGSISARCASCGAREFEMAVPAEPLTARSVLVCAGCCSRVQHRDLIYQVGDEAVRQANDALSILRRRYEAQRERLAVRTAREARRAN